MPRNNSVMLEIPAANEQSKSSGQCVDLHVTYQIRHRRSRAGTTKETRIDLLLRQTSGHSGNFDGITGQFRYAPVAKQTAGEIASLTESSSGLVAGPQTSRGSSSSAGFLHAIEQASLARNDRKSAFERQSIYQETPQRLRPVLSAPS